LDEWIQQDGLKLGGLFIPAGFLEETDLPERARNRTERCIDSGCVRHER
jgi:hypothetical protein